MKIRKILPLLAVATVAVLFLSSCDSILETLFPNDTGKGTNSGTNTITISAYMWTDPVYVTSAYSGEIHIDLMSGTTVVQSYSVFASNSDLSYYDTYGYTGYVRTYYRYPVSTTFRYVADGTYTVRVWYDANNNGVYDSTMSNAYTGYYNDNTYELWTNTSSGQNNVYVSSGAIVSFKAYIDAYNNQINDFYYGYSGATWYGGN